MSRLTSVGKLLVGLIIAGALFGFGYFVWPYFQKNASNTSGNLFKSSSADLTIGLNTWSGFAPIVWYNGGKNVNKESKVYKEYGLKLQINQMDDRKLCIEALLSGNVDAIYTTTDISSAEMGKDGQLAKSEVVQFFKVDDSRGADVIVAIRSYKSVSDLKKSTKIACAFPTASSTLLINWLDAGGKTINDVTIIPVESGIKAAELFKGGDVDLAVVWSPDDGDCIDAVNGSHRMASTKEAQSIIMDGMIAKRKVLDNKSDAFVKLVKAWLNANADMQIESNRNAAAATFSKSFGFDEFLVLDGVNKVRFSTYGDNVDFFGLNTTYNGVTGDELYTRMSKIYSRTKLPNTGYFANNPIPWVKASYSGIIESITDLTGSRHASESEVRFVPSTAADLEKPAIATRMVSINFATNEYLLSNEAKDLIDREVGPIAKGWRGAKMRVEGNTDNTGNYNYNKELSYKRAKSVVDYLVNTWEFDKNRFEVIGNGPDKPANGSKDVVSANSTESQRDANRRTDFGLIAE
jgi:NitT/TauT family transport system substrate-binding protein